MPNLGRSQINFRKRELSFACAQASTNTSWEDYTLKRCLAANISVNSTQQRSQLRVTPVKTSVMSPNRQSFKNADQCSCKIQKTLTPDRSQTCLKGHFVSAKIGIDQTAFFNLKRSLRSTLHHLIVARNPRREESAKMSQSRLLQLRQ